MKKSESIAAGIGSAIVACGLVFGTMGAGIVSQPAKPAEVRIVKGGALRMEIVTGSMVAYEGQRVWSGWHNGTN